MKVSNLEIILDQVMAGVDEASVKILDIYNDEDISIEKKGDGSPVTLADKTSHEILFPLYHPLINLYLSYRKKEKLKTPM